jgi:hypothetical protein
VGAAAIASGTRAPHLEQNLTAATAEPQCAQKGMNPALRSFRRSAAISRGRRDYKRSAIWLAIFLAASALTPDSRRSIFTMTSPLRIIRAEFPGAR